MECREACCCSLEPCLDRRVGLSFVDFVASVLLIISDVRFVVSVRFRLIMGVERRALLDTTFKLEISLMFRDCGVSQAAVLEHEAHKNDASLRVCPRFKESCVVSRPRGDVPYALTSSNSVEDDNPKMRNPYGRFIITLCWLDRLFVPFVCVMEVTHSRRSLSKPRLH